MGWARADGRVGPGLMEGLGQGWWKGWPRVGGRVGSGFMEGLGQG